MAGFNMKEKLASPIINNIVPACYKKEYKENNIEKGIVKITIPFSVNRSVSPLSVKGFVLRVKTPQNTSIQFELQTKRSGIDFDIENFTYVNFNIDKKEQEKIYNTLKVGQYYKIQIAYISEIDGQDIIGYFSNAGIMKCTSYPEVSINNLHVAAINQHQFTYTGIYRQEKDVGERVYSYNFKLYDSNNEIIKESGELIHNSSDDISLKESSDTFTFSLDLDSAKFYYIEYNVTTINGIVASSPKYRIMQRLSIDPEIHAILNASANFEEGYVDVYLIPEVGYSQQELLATGDFILSRSCADTNYTIWDNVSKFELYSQIPQKKLWRDFTVEQGKKYKYAIQQYNDANLYSNRMISNEVRADFDHAFLFDGKRQLKIKFNPKVTSLKTNIPESKVDTIGNKFPFIFRNSQVCYKEFPIAGLISYFMDEDNLFLNEDEFIVDFSSLKNLNRQFSDAEKILEKEDRLATTDPTNQNIKNERVFKLKVLEWLTNGEPKVFKSPTEGNYIVRLINCSLSPETKLGRMLHNFNCTAYEIAEFNYENLNKYGFISMKDIKSPVLQFETIEFYNQDKNSFVTGILNKHPAYYVKIINALPGSHFIFTFGDGRKEIITIGVTGAYILENNMKVQSIEIPSGQEYAQGSLTYGYYYTKTSTFETIHNAMVKDIVARQFIGEHNILKEINYIQIDSKWYKNPKVNLLQIYSVSAYSRDIIQLDDNSIFSQENGPHNKYPIYYWDNKYSEYVNNKWIHHDKNDFEKEEAQIFINSNLEGIKVPFKDNAVRKYRTLKMNYKTMAEVSYQIQEIEYIIENKTSGELYTAKQNYLQAQNNLDEHMLKSPGDDIKQWIADEKSLREAVDEKYKIYIKQLMTDLNMWEEWRDDE